MVILNEIIEVIPEELDADLLQRLSESMNNYQDIMLQLDIGKANIASDEQLKNQFASFYRFGAAREEATFKDGYFEVMQRFVKENATDAHQTITLGLILEHLEPYSKNIQRSFGSKMLHSLRENEPIWDSVVLRHLGRKSTSVSAGTREEKIAIINEIYEQIQARYITFLTEEKAVYENLYSQLIAHPQCATAMAKRLISPTKLVDFILYQYRPWKK